MSSGNCEDSSVVISLDLMMGAAMTKYVVTLVPGEDGFIVAECPSLPGCVSQGKTKDEALKNIKEAIEGILDVRREMNNPIPPPEVSFVEVAA
jgi:predicted RNase H-like HicB family nuclease